MQDCASLCFTCIRSHNRIFPIHHRPCSLLDCPALPSSPTAPQCETQCVHLVPPLTSGLTLTQYDHVFLDYQSTEYNIVHITSLERSVVRRSLRTRRIHSCIPSVHGLHVLWDVVTRLPCFVRPRPGCPCHRDPTERAPSLLSRRTTCAATIAVHYAGIIESVVCCLVTTDTSVMSVHACYPGSQHLQSLRYAGLHPLYAQSPYRSCLSVF